MESGQAGHRPIIGLWGRLSLLLTPSLGVLALNGLNPSLGKITEHFSDTPGAQSLVRLFVTVIGGAMILGAPASGFLAERVGERRLLIWSLALYAVAGLLGALANDPWLLLATRLVLGLAVAATGVLAATMLTTRIEPENRNRWLGYYTVAGTVGAFILIPLAGAIGSYNWRGVFLLHLIALPILAMIVAFIQADPPRSRASMTRDETPGLGGFLFGGVPLAVVLLSIACGIIGSTPPVYLPFLLADIGEPDPHRIAAAVLPSAVLAGLGSIFYGHVRRRFSAMDVFAGSFLLSGIGTAIAAWSGTFALVTLGTALSGLAIGLFAPNIFSVAAAAVPPERRARSMGLVKAGFFGAPMAAQLPLEPITGHYGTAAALSVIAVFAVMTTLLLFVAGRSMFSEAAATAH